MYCTVDCRHYKELPGVTDDKRVLYVKNSKNCNQLRLSGHGFILCSQITKHDGKMQLRAQQGVILKQEHQESWSHFQEPGLVVRVRAQEDFFCEWKLFRLSFLTVTIFSEWLPYSSFFTKLNYTNSVWVCFFLFSLRDGMARLAKQNIFTHNTSVSTRGHFVHISTDTLLAAKTDTKRWVLCSPSCSVFIFTLLLCFHYLLKGCGVCVTSVIFSLLCWCLQCSGNVKQELILESSAAQKNHDPWWRHTRSFIYQPLINKVIKSPNVISC